MLARTLLNPGGIMNKLIGFIMTILGFVGTIYVVYQLLAVTLPELAPWYIAAVFCSFIGTILVSFDGG